MFYRRESGSTVQSLKKLNDMMKQHASRWITGIIGFPIVVGLIVAGGLAFNILVGIASAIALCEYYRLTFHPDSATISGFILIVGLIFGTAAMWAASMNHTTGMLMAVSANFLVSGIFSLSQFKSDDHILDNLARQVQGMTYIPLGLGSLILIRNMPDGMVWVFFVVCVIFAGDIGAYYAGHLWGRHKLCPSISPGKTIEGAIGGLCANLIFGLAMKAFFIPSLTISSCVVITLVIGVAGQAGDLFESQLKRKSAIKDSGFILPGHGGLLDRIDALLFAAPLAYMFKIFLVKTLVG